MAYCDQGQKNTEGQGAAHQPRLQTLAKQVWHPGVALCTVEYTNVEGCIICFDEYVNLVIR